MVVAGLDRPAQLLRPSGLSAGIVYRAAAPAQRLPASNVYRAADPAPWSWAIRRPRGCSGAVILVMR
ncbi:hypothetical protein OG474_00240 [Kribbella sp. NBC_01505]|uniref:hypothetical protein n=1 Tax=Kribbella sp. NBC_01505 TaxID=2903580 RepID=UPI0038699C30